MKRLLAFSPTLLSTEAFGGDIDTAIGIVGAVAGVFLFFGFIYLAYLILRFAFRSLVNSSHVKFVKARVAANGISDEEYYAAVAEELRSNIKSEGLWLKAWAEMQGNESATKALYIKLRVASLKDEATQTILRRQN